MINREKILNQVNSKDDKDVIARGLDIAEIALHNRAILLSDFHNPYHCNLLISLMKTIPDLSIDSNGGYTGAERKRLAFFPQFLKPQDCDFELGFLCIEGNYSFSSVNHRDFLGSLLGLGLQRAKIGDIIVNLPLVQVIVDREVVDYIVMNLKKVGKTGVKVREINMQELTPLLPEVKEILTTVPSLRFDVIAAAAFRYSRSKMSREINAQNLTLNWQVCDVQSASVQEGDIISFRGKGRVEVAEIRGRTKKGRISLLIKKFV